MEDKQAKIRTSLDEGVLIVHTAGENEEGVGLLMKLMNWRRMNAEYERVHAASIPLCHAMSELPFGVASVRMWVGGAKVETFLCSEKLSKDKSL